jgi:ankyrin repeat protein
MPKQLEMITAIKAGDLNKVKTLVREKSSLINAHDEHHNSAVLTAAYFGKPDVLKFLLKRHPKLSVFEAAATGQLASLKAHVKTKPSQARAFSRDGFTPLHLAAFFRQASVAHYLFKFKPNVNAVAHNPTKVQPLHSAAAGNHTGICKMLIEHGANVNAKQQGGFTPLHAAAQNGNLDLVKLLLENGADKGAETDDGKTARDFALEGNHAEAAKLLVSRIGEMKRIILFARDMAAMRTFYSQVIGLSELSGASDHWAEFATGASVLALHTQSSNYKTTGSGEGALFNFIVPDVSSARDELINRGAKMREVINNDGLIMCDGEDPEGNLFSLSNK